MRQTVNGRKANAERKKTGQLDLTDPNQRGLLGAAKANKGVFVTTSYFTQPAQAFAERHPFRIVLIDGEALAGLMLRHSVGARVDETLYLKKLDEDFFTET